VVLNINNQNENLQSKIRNPRGRCHLQESKSLKNRLIDVDDSVLIVIDVQDRFLKKYSSLNRGEMILKIYIPGMENIL